MPPLVSHWITAVAATLPPGMRHEGRIRQWVFGCCLSGTCDHGQPDGERFQLAAGDVLAIRPGVRQRWFVTSQVPWKVVSCTFDPRPHWLPWLEFPAAAPGFLRLRLPGALAHEAMRCFERACTASGSGSEDAQDQTAHAVEAALLICRRAAQMASDAGDPRVRRALELQSEDLSRAMGLEELSRRCGVSIPHLQRLYRQHVGSSPAHHLATLRHQRASQLLRLTDLPVKAVSKAVGFADQRYFSAWFRRVNGESPSRYRQHGLSG
jgi:AraC family transcriptional regulator of arabinose operon